MMMMMMMTMMMRYVHLPSLGDSRSDMEVVEMRDLLSEMEVRAGDDGWCVMRDENR
jgi:hypothetical protein